MIYWDLLFDLLGTVLQNVLHELYTITPFTPKQVRCFRPQAYKFTSSYKSYLYAISIHIHPFSIPLVLWGPIPASQAEGRKTHFMDHQSICKRNIIYYIHSRSISSLLACWFDPSSVTWDTAWCQSLPVSIAPSSTRKVWDGQNPDTTASCERIWQRCTNHPPL